MEAITATYAQDDEDWTVTVAGLGKELTAKAPGIIAARDRADQLVEKISPEGRATTVVHLLNGSALEFTTVYMTARMNRPEHTDAEEESSRSDEQDDAETREGTDETTDSEDSESASIAGLVASTAPVTSQDGSSDAAAHVEDDTTSEDTDTAAQLPEQSSAKPSSSDTSSASGADPATSGVRAGSSDISGALNGAPQNETAGTGARPNT